MKKTSIIISIAIAIAVVFTAIASLGIFAEGAVENEFVGASLSLGESINVNYFATLKSEDAENAHVEFAYNGETFVAEPLAVEGKADYYKFVFENLAPQCMGNNISATLIVNGESVDTVEEYSVLQNCQNLIEDETVNAFTKQLVYDLLAYGAAAQNYADYKTDALVNAGYEDKATVVTSIENEDRTVSAPNVEGARFIAIGVYYANVNKVYAKIEIDGADASAITATVNGETAEIEKYGSEEYIIFSEAIPVSQFDKVYTVKITDGVNEQTITYSVNAYAKAKMDATNKATAELAKATYAYGQSAKAYVEYMEQQHHTICGDTCDCGENHIEILSWKPVDNAEDLQAAANAGGNYYLTEDITLDSEIAINTDVNLCLNGKKLVAADEQGIFIVNNSILTITDCSDSETEGYIEDGKWIEGTKDGAETVTIKGGILMGGSAVYGGAVNVQTIDSDDITAELNLYNVNLVNNNATDAGGAIYAKAASVEIYNCSFITNASGKNGGAIYASENSEIVYKANETLGVSADGVVSNNYTGPMFKGNRATTGGAIYVASTSKSVKMIGAALIENTKAVYVNGKAETVNCVFYKNTGGTGPAISTGSSSTYEDQGSIFVENKTSAQAGAISSYGVTTLNNSKFFRNESTGNRGGAILATDGSLEAYNVYFENNVASTNGGAVVITGMDRATFENCTFKNNTAGSRAGALYGTSDANVVTIACSFVGNKADNGGAISTATDVTYTDGVAGQNDKGSTFQDNIATGLGGAVHLTKTAELYGSKFENNLSNENGGAVYISGATSKIYGCTFTSNTAAVKGGAIYSVKTLTVDGCEFDENEATNGGALYVSAATTVNNSTFDSNKAIASEEEVEGEIVTVYGNGGAIYVVEGASLTYTADNKLGVEDGVVSTDYTGVAFKNNIASIGGAIYLEKSATASITNATFVQNKATQNGGAVYIHPKASLTDSGSVYYGNTADTNGGAIAAGYEDGNKPTGTSLTLNGTVFVENTAATRGGAIYLDQDHVVEITNTKFYRNTSKEYGGAISAARDTIVSITGSYFEANTATSRGGAIWKYLGGELNITDTDFKANTAKEGGAIRTHVGINVERCTFVENKATSNGKGGAIYAMLATTISDSDFISNNAGYGGAIYIASGTTTTLGCEFTGNTSTYYGAAVYVLANATYIDGVAPGTDPVSEGEVISSTFTSNHPKDNKYDGGAIYLAPASSLSDDPDAVAGIAYIYNAKFDSNTARSGGAIYASTGSTLTVVNCEFIKNESTQKGGAIAASSSTVNITGGKMTENKTQTGDTAYYGGAVAAFSGAQVTIEDTLISKNSGQSGGAISSYNSGTLVTLINVELSENVGYNGAIYIGSAGAVEITGLNAHDNKTTSKGAVVYITSASASTLTVNSATISGNTANGKLGFIFMNNAKNVVNINKDMVTGSDVNDNWDVLITGSGTVNELNVAE